MKDGKGPVKGLIIAAGILSVALAATVFSFFFVSAGDSEPAASSSSARYVSVGEGTTPHSKSTRQKASSGSSSAMSVSSVSLSVSSTSKSDKQEPVPSSSLDAAPQEPESPPASQPEPKPASEPEPTPEPEDVSPPKNETPIDYTNWKNGGVLVTKNAKKGKSVYHTKDCESAQNIKDGNRKWYASEEEARAHGFTLCENCASMGG